MIEGRPTEIVHVCGRQYRAAEREAAATQYKVVEDGGAADFPRNHVVNHHRHAGKFRAAAVTEPVPPVNTIHSFSQGITENDPWNLLA
jgi:hypothetical protein